jgi:hypothetical protein
VLDGGLSALFSAVEVLSVQLFFIGMVGAGAIGRQQFQCAGARVFRANRKNHRFPIPFMPLGRSQARFGGQRFNKTGDWRWFLSGGGLFMLFIGGFFAVLSPMMR